MTTPAPEELDLDALRKIAEAACPGEWKEESFAVVRFNGYSIVAADVDHDTDRAHIARFDPPTVLALIKRVKDAEAKAEDARFKLGVYRDCTELSGMSWNGFNIVGDKASIREVQRIENNSAQLDVYQSAFTNRLAAAQSTLAAAQKRIAELEAIISTHNPR